MILDWRNIENITFSNNYIIYGAGRSTPTVPAAWVGQSVATGTHVGQGAATGDYINQGSAGGSWVKKQEIDIT